MTNEKFDYNYGIMNNYSDIVLLALLALALVFKLISILGQKDQSRPINNKPGNPETIVIDKIATPHDQLRTIDPSYNEETFLENARSAFKIILEAYAQGNTRILSELVDIEMMKKFANKIVSRESLEQESEINIIKFVSATIKKINLTGREAEIAVKFNVEACLYVVDQRHKIILGDKNKVEKLVNNCVFRKNLKSSDPTWKLIDIDNIPFTEI